MPKLNRFKRKDEIDPIDCGDIVWEHDIYENILKDLGISFRAVYLQNKKKVAETILDLLEKHLPVLVCVDVFYLKYHPEYKKKHEIHIVAIYGLNQNLETAWIADNYVSTTNKSIYKGTIDNFQSVILINECSSFETLYWVIQPMEGTFHDYKYEQIKEIICSSGKRLLDSPVQKQYADGILAIKQLIEYIISIKSELKDDNTRNKLLELYTMLIPRCGPVDTRSLIAEYLEKFGKTFEPPSKYYIY